MFTTLVVVCSLSCTSYLDVQAIDNTVKLGMTQQQVELLLKSRASAYTFPGGLTEDRMTAVYMPSGWVVVYLNGRVEKVRKQ